MQPYKKDLATIRAENLQALIDTEFGGNKALFIEKTGYSLVTLNKYLNPKSDRKCPDKSAREIERLLDKPRCYLDYAHNEEKATYFITIGTDARHTYEIVKMLQADEAIQECAVVFGDFDLLLKVTVESNQFLDFLMSKIVRLPGVTSSNTYLVANNLYWQRQQSAKMELPKTNRSAYYSNGIEEFIHKKVIQLFDEIAELEKGEITAKDSDIVSFKPDQVINGVRSSLFTTKDPLRKIKNFGDFLKSEKRLIQAGVISKRLLILDENYKKYWTMIESDYNKFTEIGSTVRFIFTKKWCPSLLSEKPEEFAILDNTSVVVRREDQHRYLIKRTDSMVNGYVLAFDANWARSYSFKEINQMKLDN